MGRFLLRPRCHARVHLLGARRGPQSGRRLRRPARDRLGVAADDRRLRGERAGRRAGDAGNPHTSSRWSLAGLFGAVFGLIAGLPALRLRTFYFAMTTLGLSTIVTQIALAWKIGDGWRRRHPRTIDAGAARYAHGASTSSASCSRCSVTWMTCNISASRYGRSLVAIRDAEVAAEAVGIYKPRLLVAVFLFSGALAGVAGGLFASLQSYITPDAFTFDLSVLFFIAILIGGRGSILGPLIGTAILTILPDFAAPLVQWSTFLYAVLLLAIVLLVPGGIADLLDFRNRRPLDQHREIRPRPELLAQVLSDGPRKSELRLKDIVLSFGGVRAVDGVDLRNPYGRGAWPDRPERQRQDDDAQRHLGLLCASTGHRQPGRHRLHRRGRAYARRAPYCAHVPDAANDRRVVRARERHDRRQRSTHQARSSKRCWRCRVIGVTRRICARMPWPR